MNPTHTADRFDLITDYRSMGISAERIAADLGITPNSLYRWAERHGHKELASWVNENAELKRRRGPSKECADCGTPIWRDATRCNPCARREVNRKAEVAA